MKIALAALALLYLASPALAISRYVATDRTCADIQQAIAEQRAVLLRYPSRESNVTLYDRYVVDSGQCDFGSYAASTFVPTKDNRSCPVRSCRSSSVLQPR